MKIVFEVESLSHRVSDAAFQLFPAGAISISFHCLSETRFEIKVDAARLIADGSDDAHVEFHAYKTASMFIVALNMATVGYFWWAEKGPTGPTFQIREDGEATKVMSLSQPRPRAFDNIRDLTDLDVENAFIVWGSLVADQNHENWKGYHKGLLLLTAEHFELDFHRDAFLNFYRCIETFVTRKILRVQRLNNEVRQIQQALQQIGADQELLDAFTQVYAIRSGQVAHAQNEQRAIEFDEALVSKAFADMLMYKTYRREAEARRASYAQQRAKPTNPPPVASPKEIAEMTNGGPASEETDRKFRDRL